jgi:putative PIN family toxin of toxin-antitoxin system
MGMPREQVRALTIIVRWRVLRVVLDTNTFVAAYWSPRSASARLVAAGEQGELQLLVSAPVCREVSRILRNARTSRPYQERIARLLAAAEVVYPTRSVRLVADDPEDDKFLECALNGGADYVVSNDDHLLRLGVVEGVRIVTPGCFVRQHLEPDAGADPLRP